MKPITLFSVLIAALLAALSASLAPAQDAPDSVNLRRTWVVEVVERTKDAVVNISAEKIMPRIGFGFFVESERGTSLGSGFIVHPDGYVVTNNHVVDRARKITVELADGRKLPGTLVSSDPQADLAILKITDSKPFPVLELGDSSDLMIGEPALAVGNPFGYSHSVSTGIISALHRNLDFDNDTSMSDLLQTDAAINPGNSGGPLLNVYGKVVGINSAIRSDAQNIGFAIGVNRLRDLIPELMNPAQASKVDLPIHLKEVRTLTPPDHIDCQVVAADDSTRVLTSINGHRVADIVDAYAMLLKVRPGRPLSLSWQDGQRQTLIATAVPTPDVIVKAREKLGLALEELTPMLAEKYGLSSDSGLFVVSVVRGSIAGRAKIMPGDVIFQLGRFRLETLDDLSALMQHLPDKGVVPIGIHRESEGSGFLHLSFGDDQP